MDAYMNALMDIFLTLIMDVFNLLPQLFVNFLYSSKEVVASQHAYQNSGETHWQEFVKIAQIIVYNVFLLINVAHVQQEQY